MTLPKPCPKPDCKTPITHRHASYGALYACHFALKGRPCPHDDPACHAPRATAPRVTAPLHLPDVDAVARKIHDAHWPTIDWDAERDDVKDECRAAARAVLDLIAAHQPVWVRAEPRTRIEKGQRYRVEYADGEANERVSVARWAAQDDSTAIYVLRTPAAPLTERIRAAVNDSPESRITLDVADVEALLDMAGGEDK